MSFAENTWRVEIYNLWHEMAYVLFYMIGIKPTCALNSNFSLRYRARILYGSRAREAQLGVWRAANK